MVSWRPRLGWPPYRKEGSFDGLTGGGRRRRSGPRAARKRDALRRHQDGFVLAGSGPRARRDRRDRHRCDPVSRLLHLLPGWGTSGAASGVAAVLALGRPAHLGDRRGPDWVGR